MKIKYTEIIEKEIELDIQFPFYRKTIPYYNRTDYHFQAYYKIISEDKYYQLSLTKDHKTHTSEILEFKESFFKNWEDDIDMLTGKDETKMSNEKEFNEILNAIKIIDV